MNYKKCEYCGKLINLDNEKEDRCWNCNYSSSDNNHKKYKKNNKDLWVNKERNNINVHNIMNNIRWNIFKNSFLCFLFWIIHIGIFLFIIDAFDNTKESIITVIIFSLLTLGWTIPSMKYLASIKNARQNKVFKKYGRSVGNFCNILEQIFKNALYVTDNDIVISEEYVVNKNNYLMINKYDEVLGIHKLIHRTNNTKDWVAIILTDKYGDQNQYKFWLWGNAEKRCDNLIEFFASRCPNAYVGYSQKQMQYISNNIEELDKNQDIITNDKVVEKFYCPKCNNEIEKNDTFCKHCGNKNNW